MRISPEVEVALSLAANEAARRRHEYVTLEHLLYALLFDDATAAVIKHAGGDAEQLKKELDTYLEQELEAMPEDHADPPMASLGVQRAIRRAMAHVQSSGKDVVLGSNVLVALYAERESFATMLLERNDVARLDVVAFLSHGVSKTEDAEKPAAGPEGEAEDAASGRGDPLKAFCVNLNEDAKLGRIDPLIGRTDEVQRMVQILARRKKNNPILVGDSGVGKTAIVEGLALRIVEGKVPPSLKNATIYSLDMGSMLAGTQFRGQFEERVKSVVKAVQAIDGAVLFIDEIHTMVGAGSTRGSTMDASNLLKPALASGRLRCIGSTTFEEFRQGFIKDAALARRFQKIDVNEPSLEDTIKVLQGLQKSYEEFHGVRYDKDAVIAAATLASRYMHDRKLPDKAIDLLDESGATVKLGIAESLEAAQTDAGKETELSSVQGAHDSATATPVQGTDAAPIVTVHDVELVLSRMAHVPTREVSGSDRDRLRELDRDLKGIVFGQDKAINELVAAIKLSRAGLRSPEKPIGAFLLSGPTGVGKTEAARQLAKTMGIEFVRFDMSEYMERHSVSRLIGAPPGYVGFDQGGLLTEAVSKTPHSVLLLDEIEKAHPDVFNILLQVMDHGKLTDNNGKTTDFRHVILLMTSNIGVRDMARRTLGFQGGAALGDAEREYKRVFSPEFRNRMDARIEFAALSPDTMKHIVDKFLLELEGQLADREVTLDVTDAAKTWLAEEGYDPDMGARPLARVIQEHVKAPLSEELLFGRLENGGAMLIDAEPDPENAGKQKLVFRFPDPSTPTGPKEPAILH